MNTKIYILGSGGFAKEVYALISDLKCYEVLGFIDRTTSEPVHFNGVDVPVFSEQHILQYVQPEDAVLAIGVGNPDLIESITTRFRLYTFPNLIHPSVVYNADNTYFGVGNIVTAGVIFTISIRIGNFNVFNLSTTVGHDVKIGNNNVINPAVNISGNVSLGNTNLLGVASTVLQGIIIGNNTIIGASGLVTKDVEDGSTVIGVPARKIS